MKVVCIKCGCEDASKNYRQRDFQFDPKEWLEMRCEDCGYFWKEKCLDAVDETLVAEDGEK